MMKCPHCEHELTAKEIGALYAGLRKTKGGGRPRTHQKVLWQCLWRRSDGTRDAECFPTRKAALLHSGKLLGAGLAVQGVTKVVIP